MKKLPLKLKLTLLYSFFMILISAAALAILFSLSGREILASAQASLKEHVADSLDDIEPEDGALDIDSDFYSLEHGIYLAVYSPGGEFLYGKVPHDLTVFAPLTDGELQTVSENNTTWYIYDILYEPESDYTFYVRGITSASKAENNFRIALRFALVLLPLMILLTSLLGYYIINRSLRPVRTLTDTVEQIRANGDLSLRTGSHPNTERNLDEIHYLADTFDLMLDELEAAFLREKQFTSDVSHELRTPVSVICAQSEALLENTSLPEELRSQAEVIYRKSHQISTLISHLLLLSRADQNRAILTFEYLNLSELTEMTVEEQTVAAASRHIQIHTEITPDLFACVDETAYFRLLINLLSNAVTYGKENGNVWITLTPSGSDILLQIRDDGIGMSEEVLSHIWERFYRADSSRTGDSHFGLGLSMVQWIVTAHGGTITAQSKPSAGSTFTVFLPASHSQENFGPKKIKKNEKNERF